jgi:hypothetical protein
MHHHCPTLLYDFSSTQVTEITELSHCAWLLFVCFLFGKTGVCTQGFVLAMQMLNCEPHLHSIFLWIFWR